MLVVAVNFNCWFVSNFSGIPLFCAVLHCNYFRSNTFGFVDFSSYFLGFITVRVPNHIHVKIYLVWWFVTRLDRLFGCALVCMGQIILHPVWSFALTVDWEKTLALALAEHRLFFLTTSNDLCGLIQNKEFFLPNNRKTGKSSSPLGPTLMNLITLW